MKTNKSKRLPVVNVTCNGKCRKRAPHSVATYVYQRCTRCGHTSLKRDGSSSKAVKVAA